MIDLDGTLFATDVQVLVPYVCSDLTVIPDQRGHNAVADQELKYRYRFVDMITDPTVAPVRRIQKLTLGDQAPVTTVIDFKADRGGFILRFIRPSNPDGFAITRHATWSMP